MKRAANMLVTGGAGFIGRTLVPSFANDGWNVTVADRVPFPGPIHSIVGDLGDPDVLQRAVSADTDVVVHLAAATSVVRTVDDPAGTYQLNVRLTAELLELCRTRGVESVLLASTNAVAGNVGRAIIDENTPPRPLTPYGATKAAAEMLLSGYAASYGLKGCAVRLANVVGPDMAGKDNLVSRVLRAADAGEGIEIYGDGTQVRDFLSIWDAVAGFRTALRAKHVGPLVIGSGESVSVNRVVELARQVTGISIPVTHIAAKRIEMPAVVLDITVARRLGYTPMNDLEATLAQAWLQLQSRSG
jgi:UDP-glucose 4-epimerase